LVKFYDYGKEAVAEVEAERGYYFIEGQSHYEGGHLPEGFKLDTDRPDLVLSRKVRPQGPNFEQLNALAMKYGFQVLIVPMYYRVGEFAPPPPVNALLAQELRPYPAFQVVGPDYLLFDNRYFSDPAHANRVGALLYTRQLAELLKGNVFGEQSKLTPPGRMPSEPAR
jgi:hypothetical protein